jgi:xylulokinase
VTSATIGLDIGTSGARALAVDESGEVVAAAAEGYPLLTPRPGWTEQDPEDWWRAACKVLAEVAGAVHGDVAAIGLTGQMHGAVFLDGDDRVIRNALLWNDQRTAAQCAEITERVGRERLLAITGNLAVTGFQAPKVLWLRQAEPSNYGRIAHVLLPKDFIRLRLAGEYATDASDASGTLLLDLRRRSWSAEILDALEVPRGWLPAVLEGPEEAGRLRAGVAAELGLPAGIPIAAGGGDNAAAAIGSGIVKAGLASSSIGTSGVIFAYTPEFTHDPSGRLHAFCHAAPGAYHLMGVTLSAGGSLNWWRHVLGEQLEYDALIELAASAPVGSEGLLFLPYLSGERTPHLDPFARGAFFGLTARHGLNHLTRAVMEGVVYSLAESLQLMVELGIELKQVRAVGGGARSALWRQIQADVYGMPVQRTTVDEGPAYGAALLAGVTSGRFASVNEACSVVRLRTDVAEPNGDNVRLYRGYLEVYRDLYPATAAAMARLTALCSTDS